MLTRNSWKVSAYKVLSKFKDRQSSYNHVSYLMANNFVTILSQFLFAPLLTRVYSPEAYGVASVLFALGLNISTLLTMCYEQSLFFEVRQRNRDLISSTVVTWSFVVCSFILLFVLLNPDAVSGVIGIPGGSFWMLLLLPVYIFILVLCNMSYIEVTLKKKYKDTFTWGAPGMVGSKFFSLGYGYIRGGHFSGLFLGEVLLKLYIALFRVLISLKKNLGAYLLFSRKGIKKGLSLLRTYKRFPYYELPASYFSLFVGQVPIYFLTFLKANAVVGWFSISISLLEAPIRLISFSVSPILMQKLTEMKNNMDGYRKILEKTFTLIFLIILVPSLILFFYGKDLFSLFFGEKWIEAGIISSSFIFVYLFRFELDLLYNVLTVMGFQKKKFLVFLIEGIIRISLLVITYLIVRDPLRTIIIWASECALVYYFVTLYAYGILRLKLTKLIILKTLVTGLFLLAFVWKFVI